MPGTPTNDNIYRLVDEMRREVKSDLIRLENQLDDLSKEVGALKVNNATLNTKIYVLVFIVTVTVSGIINAVTGRLGV